MTALERAARAICATSPDGYDPDELVTKGDPPRGPTGEWRDGEWRPAWPRWMSFEPQARAALEAIREPSEDMERAGAGVWLGGNVHGMSEEWHSRIRATFAAMIDAALAEGRAT